MGLTVSNDRSRGEQNSYTAAAALMGGLESLVVPPADLTTPTAQNKDKGLDVNASNGANLGEYAKTLLKHEQMMKGFKDLSFPVSSLVQYSNAA